MYRIIQVLDRSITSPRSTQSTSSGQSLRTSSGSTSPWKILWLGMFRAFGQPLSSQVKAPWSDQVTVGAKNSIL